MNHVYSLVWNRAAKQWLPAPEGRQHRSSRQNAQRRTLCAGVFCAAVCIAALAEASPQGGQVTSGSGGISRSGTTTIIQQNSETLGLNWASFNVASSETVNFVQPNSSALAVNRILSSTGSQILGHVNANGQVWLINPNGVLFGKGSQVDVAGLVASSLDTNGMSADGSAHFAGSGRGDVVNNGTISASSGGYVVLIANRASNEGIISAQLGTVAEVGGSAATLAFEGDRLLQVEVDQSTLGNLAENRGLITASGGKVYMTAGARDTLLASSVNNSGVISATSIEHRNGSVVLTAGAAAGEVTIGGTTDVSSNTGTGGDVTATAHTVAVTNGANVDASGGSGGGSIRIGGGWEGGEGIAQATTVGVAPGATLNASATRAGDGGEVIVRSDVDASDSTTRVNGTMLAQGGPNGGNGGRIETSGHWLDVTGSVVQASAIGKGTGGEWLLDPYNVTIAGSGTAVGAGSYVPSADSTISASSIATALQGGSNVTITTGTTGSSNGDVTVASAITKASGNTDVTLTLQAADSVIITPCANVT
jgi:filamentous hemagglutinin family protein